jgi:RimJ/RimL family protein N-acetyltransferase
MKNPFLIGSKIYLRAPEPGDEKVFALSENHPDPRETLYYALPTSIETHLKNINQKSKDFSIILFTICSLEPDEPIGNTAFVRIDWIGRMATFYIAIAEKENWSKKFGKEAVQLMVDYAFETLNLNRIQLHVSVENERAIKVYKNSGFVIEGTLRQAMYFKNTYHDFYLMAILKEDWIKKLNPPEGYS